MSLTRVEGYNYWLEGQHVNLYMIPLDVIVIPGYPLKNLMSSFKKSISLTGAVRNDLSQFKSFKRACFFRESKILQNEQFPRFLIHFKNIRFQAKHYHSE